MWTEPGYACTIQPSPEVLDQIRKRSAEGLASLAKTGLGVGGLLLGRYLPAEGVVYVDGHLELPCSHQGGPSFNLNPPERVEALRLADEKRPQSVVGWYFSKTQPPAAPGAEDLDLFETLCPSPWQLMLLIRPGASDQTQGTMFFRDASGQIVRGTQRDIREAAIAGSPLPADPPEAEMGFQPAKTNPPKVLTSAAAANLAAVMSHQRPRVKAPGEDSNSSGRDSLGAWRDVIDSAMADFSVPAPPTAGTGEASGIADPSDVEMGFQPVRTFNLVPGSHAPPAQAKPAGEESNPPAVVTSAAAANMAAMKSHRAPRTAAPAENTDPKAVVTSAAAANLAAVMAQPHVKSRPAPEETGEAPEIVTAAAAANLSAFRGMPHPPSATPGNDLEVGQDNHGFQSVRSFQLKPDVSPDPVLTPVPDEAQEDSSPQTIDEELGFKPVKSYKLVARKARVAARESRATVVESGEVEDANLSPARPSRRKWILIGAGVLTAISIAVASLSSGSSLKLELSESNGHITAIWNADAVPARSIGNLEVDDGGATTNIALNETKMRTGVVGFDVKSGKVNATLKSGKLQANASWEGTARSPAPR